MNQNKLWRFVLVVLVLLWSLYELYPPEGRNLLQYFRERAVDRDPTFTAIYKRAQELEKAMPEKPYDNLVEAIGTNDITKYFPFYGGKNEQHPTAYILNRLQRQAAGRIRLGLDLQGGTSFVMSMETNNLVKGSDISTAIAHAVEVLRKRVDKFGVAEPIIQPEGSDRILVQLPGLSAADQEEAKVALTKPAYLTFNMVNPQSKELIEQGITEPGYEKMKLTQKGRNGQDITEEILVKKRPEMDGSGIKSAMVVRGNLGEPEINFAFDADAARKFGEITTEYVHQRMAIILDGMIYSAPVIQEPIMGGSGRISGSFDQKEAFTLANVLENPLRAPLKLEESHEVNPTLGRDSIRSGIKASIYGTLAVSAFMLVYYMVAGMVANVALIANIIILLGVMCSIGTTLTLPGIAGVVLTVGMAVDANVLIYERIREETNKGKSLRGAVAAGYSRAFGTIFDSHVTTLISSIILAYMGTGTIKGFGVALTIGVAASLFTALVVTRMIFDFLLDRNWLKSIPMLHIIRAAKLDFMKLALPAFIMSWVLIAIGCGYGIYRGKSAFGVDFLGGDTSTFGFVQHVDEAQIRSALAKADVKDPTIQYQTDLSSGVKSLRIVSATGTGDTVKKVLTAMPGAKFYLRSQEHIGATVGAQITRSAVIASLLSLFGILVYVAIRYEFSFAVGAVLAVIHDVLMTIGWYCLSGREFNATTVAAILTIIGFSTNDTIVIFDRIRENLKLGVRGTFREVMNGSLNQTLSRTIITSGTVFLATLSLYIFGGGAINDFAFTFLVGIITGTYSSIYIASALVLWWHKGQRPHIGVGAQAGAEAATPAAVRP
ncbi:MAG TPA: protein translocase subunit SecD [Candidatus Acidoferrum sp.]|nr:protein translocase subunit SecD [Candidatus Acidoferrum sp.]